MAKTRKSGEASIASTTPPPPAASKKRGASSSRAPQPAKKKGKKTKVSRPSLTNQQDIVFKDDEQRKRYNSLVKRKLVNTRYMDEYTMTVLGIEDDVMHMFDRLGWRQLMTGKWPTYERITLEFLSSVQAEIPSSERCGEGWISFRLFNNDHKLNLEAFNGIFGLPAGGKRTLPLGYNYVVFMQMMTDNGASQSLRASFIRNPCFWYVQRVMAHTVFARGESDGILRHIEVMLLEAMVGYSDFKVDTGSYIARQMLKAGQKTKGDIVIGGLITPIALHFGYTLTDLKQASGNPRIDLNACVSMKLLERVGESYSSVLRQEGVPNSELFPLPNKSHTTIHNPENWSMRHSSPPLLTAPPSPIMEPRGNAPPIHSEVCECSRLRQSVVTLEAEVQVQRDIITQLQSKITTMDGVLQSMYSWHVSQGHFPPAQ